MYCEFCERIEEALLTDLNAIVIRSSILLRDLKVFKKLNLQYSTILYYHSKKNVLITTESKLLKWLLFMGLKKQRLLAHIFRQYYFTDVAEKVKS